jgi:hypothetical protein
MYRRPKFLEILLQIRREMAVEADYDVDLFAEVVRSGANSPVERKRQIDPTAKAVTEQNRQVRSADGVLP